MISVSLAWFIVSIILSVIGSLALLIIIAILILFGVSTHENRR